MNLFAKILCVLLALVMLISVLAVLIGLGTGHPWIFLGAFIPLVLSIKGLAYLNEIQQDSMSSIEIKQKSEEVAKFHAGLISRGIDFDLDD